MENMQEKLDKALDLINQDEFSNAEKILTEILSVEPQNIEVIKNLGLCHINLDNPIDAINYFKKVIEIDENDATSIFYLANCYSRIGNKQDALNCFLKVLELRPDYIDVYKSLGMLYVELGLIDNAIELVHKALNNPSIEADYTLNYILATSYMLKKDNTNAIIFLERALTLNDAHLPIMNSLGSCYMSSHKFDKAQEVLKRAYDIDNSNPLTIFNLGILNQTIGNYKEALNYFQTAYQIEPSVTMLTSLASCALKAGEFALASVMYKNLVMIYPNNSDYRYSYVEALENIREYKEALDNVNFLLSLDEKNIDLIKKKGSLLRRLGFCNEAIDVLNTLLKRGKIDVELYYNLAYSYVELGDYDNAKEMFKKCIILEPNNPYAHKDLGVLYLKMNCYDWAVDEMLEAIELESDVSEFHYSLGVSYLMLSKINEGKNALLEALKYEPDNVDALAFLGYAYLLEKDYANSLTALQKALSLEPDNFLAENHSAKYYFDLKKYDTAKQFLLDIVEQVQDDETINMLGICYLEEKNYKDAIGCFSKLAKTYSNNHILLTNLARCEYEIGKKNEAMEHIRQALMIFDDYTDALNLLEEINNG